MKYLFLVLITLSVVTLYLLTLATGNANKMGEYFWLFVGINSLLLFALLTVVFQQVWTMHKNIKHHVFGAKLTRKLMLVFSLVTILPSILLLMVSIQFISHSIESWFGKNTESAFEYGMQLSKSALNLFMEESKNQALRVQVELSGFLSLEQNSQVEEIQAKLEQLKSKYKADSIALYATTQVAPIAFARRESNILAPVLDQETQKKIEEEKNVASTEHENDHLYSRIWLLLPTQGRTAQYYLMFEQKVVDDIAHNALLLESARADYAKLTYAKDAMQMTYLMTLSIATLLAVMLSLTCALFFSKRFTAPLFALSVGTKAVAQGDFSQRSPIFRQDELGVLSSSFNRMTEQLAEAQEIAKMNQQKQEAARIYLENVLTSLSAGVVAFDPDNKVRIANFSAEQILGLSFSQLEEYPWTQWTSIKPETNSFVCLMQTIMSANPNKIGIQVDYHVNDKESVLLAKSILLPEHIGGGFMLVFDDVTELVKAQKDAAWGEVAKRLAHEIRNPLTPIQLSAERLAMKLESKLSEQDANMLIRSTDTIIKQVNALKGMVEAFRNYARSPATNLQQIDLNKILSEVLVLYESYACKITQNLSKMPIKVRVDVGMMRQVFHNLLQNSQDAVSEIDDPSIDITTFTEQDTAIIVVTDNGKGFDEGILQKAFEPYVTSKSTGTGLGLAVVKKIIDEHNGKIVISNQEAGGACIRISLPLVEA
ncbi:ATP-binding protein [Neisseria sp. Ec49-e6-T10]|uniref:ATP-binding protein n=1 Tax=Neisseria sp. Ec49-e6-T10 TaxID=3140744 RepID=UPI003EBF9857